ncbi:50S ribosomal protein L31e [bacterium]|nr:50S ribosomal protein L31e [bacterium]
MERIYTIPLREVKEAPRTRRAKKAIHYIRSFLEKHMKTEEVIIDQGLNEKVWERGIENIPQKIRVKAEKQEDGSVIASLVQ